MRKQTVREEVWREQLALQRQKVDELVLKVEAQQAAQAPMQDGAILQRAFVEKSGKPVIRDFTFLNGIPASYDQFVPAGFARSAAASSRDCFRAIFVP
jgi:hypothetical protein